MLTQEKEDLLRRMAEQGKVIEQLKLKHQPPRGQVGDVGSNLEATKKEAENVAWQIQLLKKHKSDMDKITKVCVCVEGGGVVVVVVVVVVVGEGGGIKVR